MANIQMRFIVCVFYIGILSGIAFALPVFPGAVGFGTDTRAAFGLHGVDPVIYTITNLKSSGDGSLKGCIDLDVPRICIFEVSGYIPFQARLTISNPYITIAGQTAPSPGITLKDATLTVDTHDVLIQHIRVRTSAYKGNPPNFARDCLNMGYDAQDVVIDHGSFSWALDENVALGRCKDVTFSNSIVSEALINMSDPQYTMSKGIMTGNSENIFMYHNLFAQNSDRNPYFPAGSHASAANNLAYNHQIPGMITGKDGPSELSFVGNHLLSKLSPDRVFILGYILSSGTKIFLKDNKCLSGKQEIDWNFVENWNHTDPAETLEMREQKYRSDDPVRMPPDFVPDPVDTVYDHVLDNAGARPLDRDAVDQRIIKEVQSESGGYKYVTDTLEWPDENSNPKFISGLMTHILPSDP